MSTDTVSAREHLASRVKDMRAMLALWAGDIDAGASVLKDYGYWPVEPDDCIDPVEAAYEIAGSYVLDARVLYRAEDSRRVVSRVELLLTCGGPTEVIIWDERGAGWSGYLYSWSDPAGADFLGSEDYDVVTDFLRAFIVPDLEG